MSEETVESASTTERLPLEQPTERAKVAPSGFAIAMCCAILFRALIFSLGVLSIYTAEGKLNPDNTTGIPWVAWDGNHYVNLIYNGYPKDLQGPRFALIAFFPVLPMITRPLAMIMPGAAALVLIANLCAVVGFGFLYSWARQLVGPRVAIISVLVFSTYPGAVFF